MGVCVPSKPNKPMTKEIKVVNKEQGLVRVTTVDERWYAKETTDKKTGLPVFQYKPSASWIAGKYPKGIGYFKWLAEKGWDEAEAIKMERGKAGSKVHQACEQICNGQDVKFDDKFTNTETGQQEELTTEEYEAVISFRNWWDSLKELNPRVIKAEFTIWADRYAGTCDLLMEADGGKGREVWLIDFKTSQSIFDSHTIQLNSYFHAPIVIDGVSYKPNKMFILQLGYRKNKNKYKLTEVEDNMAKFEVAYQIWSFDHAEDQPLQRDLPLVIEGIKK